MTADVAPNLRPTPSGPRRRWGQWSLRTLLIATTVIAVGPGGWVVYQRQEMQRQERALAKLRQPGVEVYARRHWLWTLLAGRSSGQVVGLGMRNLDQSEARMSPVADLADLIWLDAIGPQTTDADLFPLARLTKLQRLRVDESQVTDAGLVHLAGLRRLEALNLSETQVTDAGLVYLAGLSRLETLSLRKTRATDAGVQQLQQALPNLKIER